MTSNRYQQIYTIVRCIPRGRVATYGQVAALLGRERQARQVGYALHALPEGSSVPWHRVINTKGEVSLRSDPYDEPVQRRLLEAEGIVFDARGRCSLEKYRWDGE